MAKKRRKVSQVEEARDEPERPLRVLVSSVVYGYEDFLEGIYAILGNFGYEVLMSHNGTIPIDPEISVS